ELEAPAAPAFLDDLRVRPVDVDPYASVAEHVEVLEGHRDEVGELERVQCVECGCPAAGVPDPTQIPLDVESDGRRGTPLPDPRVHQPACPKMWSAWSSTAQRRSVAITRSYSLQSSCVPPAPTKTARSSAGTWSGSTPASRSSGPANSTPPRTPIHRQRWR